MTISCSKFGDDMSSLVVSEKSALVESGLSLATLRYKQASKQWLNSYRVKVVVPGVISLAAEAYAITYFSKGVIRNAQDPSGQVGHMLGVVYTVVALVVTLVGVGILLRRQPQAPEPAAVLCISLQGIKNLSDFIVQFPPHRFCSSFKHLFQFGIIAEAHRKPLEKMCAEHKKLTGQKLPYADFPSALKDDTRIISKQNEARTQKETALATLETSFQELLVKIKGDLPDPLSLMF